MAIIVPVLAKVEWAPQIDDSSIPSCQHEALQHIVQLLGLLARLDRDFRTAVALFNASHDENSDMARAVEAGTMSFGDLDLATDTLSGWQKMAARDGALSIYHFGQAGEAVRKSLPTCAALNAKVDHDALKVALADFRKAFNRYEAIRHVVGHVADWSATRALRRKHSHKGPWKGGSKTVQIDIQDAAAETQLEVAPQFRTVR